MTVIAAALEIPASSLEYVLVPETLTVNGLPVDPTSPALTVELAFTAVDVAPASGDWTVGSWEDVGGVWNARCLVGPGGTVTLAAGTYDVWTRVTASPEKPVRKAPGRLVVV